MNIVARNTIIGMLIGLGFLGANGASALDWSEAPQVVGTIVGAGVGGTIGSVSINPFISGAAGATGGLVGAKVGPYVAENPKKSGEIFGIALSGPTGMISSAYKASTSAALSYIKNLFW